jgi:hypothetical protein
MIEHIHRQPKGDTTDCAYYAVMNLYLRCGLTSPNLEAMKRRAPVRPDASGLTMFDAFRLLLDLDFPLLCSFAVIPQGQTARDVIAPLLDEGYAILFGMNLAGLLPLESARDDFGDAEFAGMPIYVGHAGVAHSWADTGLTYLCSSWNVCHQSS